MNPLTNHQKLKWGILGCARVARQVMAPGIQQSRNGTIQAVASRSLENARQFARNFDIERSYDSYDELLCDPDIQAIYNPLPNNLHKYWTIRAAEAGKHVLCEKPLAVDASEGREMVTACKQNNVTLMEAFAHTFQPQNLHVKWLIDRGRIGKILRLTAVHSSARPLEGDVRLDKNLAGGVLMDKGCYCVNTARFLFGAEPISVYATAEFGTTSGVDERVIATLEFPAGGVAQFDCSFSLAANSSYCQSYEVFGASGHIYVPQGVAQVETYRFGKIVDSAFYIGDDAISSPTLEKNPCRSVHQWQLEAEYFADCVLQGKPLEFPHENGLANTLVMDAIYKSARQGQRVQI